MATLKVKLRPSKVVGKAGVIYYQITHNRKTRQISTRLRVRPSEWDSDEEKLTNYALNRAMIQSRIDSDVALLRRVILDLDSCGVDYSVEDVVSRYKSPQSHILVLDYMRTQADLIPVSCAMSRTSIHSSSGTLSIRSRPLNLFLTSTV